MSRILLPSFAILIAATVFPGCQSTSQGDAAADPRNPITAEFGEAVDRQPTPKTLFAASRILTARGKHEQARYVLSRVIEADPTFSPAYVELAESLMRDDRSDEAANVLRTGLTHAPDDPLLHNDLGMVLLIRGEEAEAIEHFTAAVDADPHNARFQANRATALAMSGAYDDAFQDYVAVMPVTDAHHNLGVIAETRGDTERAAAEFALAEQTVR